MLIVCPSCASEYTIDPTKLGAEGRTLRCAVCRDTWFVPNPDQSAEPPEPDASAPELDPPHTESARSPILRQRVAKRPRPSRRVWLAGASLAVGLLVGLAVTGRVAVEAWRPPAERLAAALGLASPGRGLAFRNLTSELVGAGPDGLLHVEGEIVSLIAREIHLPKLEFSVRNADDQVVATWTNGPPRPTLEAGEAVRFSTRLTSPPADGRQVHVHFVAGGLDIAAHQAR